MVNILLLEFIDIAFGYYAGVGFGLIFMAWYLYGLKRNKDTSIALDMKYVDPFIISLVIAVFQLAFEIAGTPIPVSFANPLEAFFYGFIFYAGVQEALKALLKWDRIDFFNTAA